MARETIKKNTMTGGFSNSKKT